MNKSELLTYIKEPHQLGKSQLAALRKVESDFPYFQVVQVLLAKSLSIQKHYEFGKQLHKTGLSVPNREVLYRFINDLPSEFLESPTILPYTTPVKEPAVLTQEEPKELEEVVPVKEDVPAEIPVIELANETEPLEIKVPIEEAISLEPVIQVNVEKDSVIVSEEKSELKEVERSTFAHHQEEVHSFMEWLKMSKGEEPERIPSVQASVENIPSTTIEAPQMEKVGVEIKENPTPQTEEIKSDNAASNVGAFESILDRFIRESPTISRPKAEFYKPSNMAKQSIIEDEDLVTETLAKLYYNQGHLKKAIRAYEELCLIYPHKMAYFADLIYKIKQESKD